MTPTHSQITPSYCCSSHSNLTVEQYLYISFTVMYIHTILWSSYLFVRSKVRNLRVQTQQRETRFTNGENECYLSETRGITKLTNRCPVTWPLLVKQVSWKLRDANVNSLLPSALQHRAVKKQTSCICKITGYNEFVMDWPITGVIMKGNKLIPETSDTGVFYILHSSMHPCRVSNSSQWISKSKTNSSCLTILSQINNHNEETNKWQF